MNRKAFQNITYGLYIISTKDNERPTGCIANSVMQITSEPATIAISINHDNYTNSCIERTGKFAVTVLSNNCDPEIIGTFGFQTGEKVNKFDSVSHKFINDMPILSEGCAYITCDVISKNETSTHTIFIGKVTDADTITNEEPMTYAYYHKVIKGKSPKNAPTYIPDENEAAKDDKKKYVCSVCGYEYDGEIPFDELPDTYTCPICGHPKSAFIVIE